MLELDVKLQLFPLVQKLGLLFGRKTSRTFGFANAGESEAE